jgi:hypothetical protein
MNKESLLQIWFDNEPTAKSPYGLYGYPAMWETMKNGEFTLFSRPGKTSERGFGGGYVEVDGIHYQWQKNGQWIGQGRQTTFAQFEANGPCDPLNA